MFLKYVSEFLDESNDACSENRRVEEEFQT